jgi:uncharacterized PurR-regulated membrane protein YhhQ (DUF165 family)
MKGEKVVVGSLNKYTILKLWFFHIVIIAVSNYLVQFPVTVGAITFTWAMFTFPLVVLATDLTIRLMGQATARTVVALAYIPAILISVYLADWRIGIASGTAYLVSQLLDIFIFQKIRERVVAWWAAPLVATLVSNVIDTYTFYSVAFYKSADSFMAENWVHIASVDLVFKTIVSLLIILPLYGIVLNYAQKKAGAT